MHKLELAFFTKQFPAPAPPNGGAKGLTAMLTFFGAPPVGMATMPASRAQSFATIFAMRAGRFILVKAMHTRRPQSIGRSSRLVLGQWNFLSLFHPVGFLFFQERVMLKKGLQGFVYYLRSSTVGFNIHRQDSMP